MRPLQKALYPLRALVYFLQHPSLWKIIICPIIATIVSAILAFILIFALALYPQYLLIVKYLHHQPISWILAVLLCLIEVSLTVLAVSFFVFFQGTRARIYKRVFQIEQVRVRKAGDRATQYHTIEDSVSSALEEYCLCWVCLDVANCCKNFVFCCCIDPRNCGWYLTMRTVTLLLFVVSLPLNLIPVVGTFLFCILNGTLMAWGMQLNYFKQKQLPPNACTFILRKRWPEYMSFGSVCLLLDLIPVVNIVLIYTNIIASALWIVDIERAETYDEVRVDEEELSSQQDIFNSGYDTFSDNESTAFGRVAPASGAPSPNLMYL